MAGPGSAAFVASRPSLWRHRDFMLLWVGQSVSRLGDQFTALAVPIIAAFSLGAQAAQMGLLAAAGTLPFLLFGLPAGVWVDRWERRRVLILGDLARGILVGAIAVLGIASLLRLDLLYVLAFVIGVLTVFFDIAYQAYLPSLVDRAQLVEGNSKLETTNSLAGVTGPAVAGFVIHLLSAPFAMVFDAASFFFSSGTLVSIRARERPKEVTARRSLISEVREGLHVVFGDARLRSIAGCTAWSNFFNSIVFNALLILYLKDNLGYDALLIGLLFGIAGLGGVVGAIVVGKVTDRVGVGPAIVLSAVVFGLGTLPLPFVGGPTAFPILAIALFATFVANVIYNINQVSFRQTVVPLRLQGRLNATMRTIVWGTLPLGALVGGLLGDLLGLQRAILVGVIGGAFGFLFVLLSPVRHIRSMPEPAA